MSTDERPPIRVDGGELICDCGNEPCESGWEFCNPEGFAQEPLADSDWDNTYRCNDCGNIALVADDWESATSLGIASDEARETIN